MHPRPATRIATRERSPLLESRASMARVGESSSEHSSTAWHPIRLDRLDDASDETLFAALTALLHAAYAEQVRMGLQPLAGRQDIATTRRRCRSGETWLARCGQDPTPIGMILLHEIEEAEVPSWFRRPDVAHFSLLAVDPRVQRAGVGARLVAHAEATCAAAGMAELALSMAEPDTPLMGWYVRRGYRVVDHWQWPYTNYRSLIMSRRLRAE